MKKTSKTTAINGGFFWTRPGAGLGRVAVIAAIFAALAGCGGEFVLGYGAPCGYWNDGFGCPYYSCATMEFTHYAPACEYWDISMDAGGGTCGSRIYYPASTMAFGSCGGAAVNVNTLDLGGWPAYDTATLCLCGSDGCVIVNNAPLGFCGVISVTF
ncbi:MAG: hypothetical protein HZB29_01125 [Nitrospinae bacterium]|nr:hypothetical protein [Nitrospinota bacterium]